MSLPIAPGLEVPDTTETRTYSAALYQLADQIEAEGVMTVTPETIRQAAQRLDEQTVCINYLKKRLPDGWKPVPVEPTQAMLDAAHQLGDVFSLGDEYRVMLSAAPAAPAVPDDVVKDAERYRYLRDNGDGFDIAVREDDEDGESWVHGYPPDELDAAIDAAMQEGNPA